MDAERARAFLLSLPHVVETQQWGERLVFWIADKSHDGKMFALIDLGPRAGTLDPVVSFAAGKEHQAELLERDGLRPAPYLARAGWVAADRWNALSPRKWFAELRSANETVWAKLPPRSRARILATLLGPGRLRPVEIGLRVHGQQGKKAAEIDGNQSDLQHERDHRRRGTVGPEQCVVQQDVDENRSQQR